MAPTASAPKHTPKKAREVHPSDELQCVNPDAAGIDVGSRAHHVSVPPDRDEKPVRTFGCFTPDLLAMAQWLKQCRVRTIVMESTGVYWVPLFRVLEDAGFEVLLVDARQAKNVPGRKSDVRDCRWLRQLHTYGLLRGCFIPPRDIQTVRSYWRHRESLVEAAAQQIHLMQKALEQMNIQLHKAISDIAGVTGLRIIRAIVAGERDALTLAQMKERNVRSSEETLVKALTGHYSEEHVFALQQALEAFDFYHRQLADCDKQVQGCMSRFESKAGRQGQAPGEPGEKQKRYSRRKNQPHFDLGAELNRVMGVDLTQADGIQALTAQVVFAEVGPDVSAFRNEKCFSSWLCLCPNNRITGGRIRSSRTRHSQNRLTNALRIAAQSMERSPTWLGAYYRRMKAMHGAAHAVTDTAHKLACIIYRMLKYGEEYVRKGQEEYEAHYAKQALKRLEKQAERLGYALVSQTTGEIAPAFS